MQQADTGLGHGAGGGAGHAAVGFALQRLIEHRRAGRDQRDAEKRLQQTQMEGTDAGGQRAEVKAPRGGKQHHGRNPRLRELQVVGEQRGRARTGAYTFVGFGGRRCGGNRHSSLG